MRPLCGMCVVKIAGFVSFVDKRVYFVSSELVNIVVTRKCVLHGPVAKGTVQGEALTCHFNTASHVRVVHDCAQCWPPPLWTMCVYFRDNIA